MKIEEIKATCLTLIEFGIVKTNRDSSLNVALTGEKFSENNTYVISKMPDPFIWI